METESAVAGVSDNIQVIVVLAMPDVQYQLLLAVPAGTEARQAVKRALSEALVPINAKLDIDPLSAPLGVFGEVIEGNYVLSDGDRVEIYRPLQQDPKEWRRRRAREQG